MRTQIGLEELRTRHERDPIECLYLERELGPHVLG
jgi:hypothetical protein